ncbi:MAG: hypothetical protein NWE95_12535 [Candidatus Bathyarchaeota archaeon]|nr:hypothetical protein [Candidatus Bathyarchaeota archaeon]
MTKTPKVSRLNGWYKTRKEQRKKKTERERILETPFLKIVTLIVTLVAVALGTTFLPLFPQPLPILIAILIAFVTFIKPLYGMPIAGAIIGLGLLNNLAKLYFISFLGDTLIRITFIIIWMAMFIGLPLIFNSYKSALAFDFGILAVTVLFFAPTYFLAVPLLLASIVFFKKNGVLSVIYYALISIPLQIMQYFTYVVLPIKRVEWWLEPGSAPPLMVPLNLIGKDLTSAMSQFRLYDTSKIIYDIAGQTTWEPNWVGRTIKDALSQYLDSLPGIIMFVIMVAGLAFALVFFTRLLVSGGSGSLADKLFPCLTATFAAVMFFILLDTLERPLAYTADISAGTIVFGSLATLLFTLPVVFMDVTPKQTVTITQVRERAQALKERLGLFNEQIRNVKENIPVSMASSEGKALVIGDSFDELFKKIETDNYDQSELDPTFDALGKLNADLEFAEAELNATLAEYQVFVNCEFSNWVGKLKEAGLDVKTTLNAEYHKELSVAERVVAIKAVLEAGRALTQEVIVVADPLYGIIKPLYDPSLPEKCRVVEFASQKLQTNEAPWIAIEALYNALNNWKRQYGSEIRASMRYLHKSLSPLAYLSGQADVLPWVFGDNTPKVLAYSKKAEDMKSVAAQRIAKEELSMVDLFAFKDDVQTSLAMSNDVLSMLYAELISEEETIERLLPTKDYIWEKNGTLRERLKVATETLSNPSKFKINQIMENLPTYLSYMDEAVQTLAVYSERKELLLNYPLAEAAIEEQLKEKEKLTPRDLPFQPQFAGEYLRLYYTQRYGEFAFDKDNLILTRRK